MGGAPGWYRGAAATHHTRRALGVQPNCSQSGVLRKKSPGCPGVTPELKYSAPSPKMMPLMIYPWPSAAIRPKPRRAVADTVKPTSDSRSIDLVVRFCMREL